MAAPGEKSWPSVESSGGRPWGGSHGRRQWPMVAVELLMAGLIVVLVPALAGLAWVTGRRREAGLITEAQARENAAPLDDGDPGVRPSRARGPVMPPGRDSPTGSRS